MPTDSNLLESFFAVCEKGTTYILTFPRNPLNLGNHVMIYKNHDKATYWLKEAKCFTDLEMEIIEVKIKVVET